MKKIILTTAIAFMSVVAFSQKGENQIGIGADVGIPTGDFGDGFGVGIGGYLKGLLGVGSAGQMTFTTGYMTFGMKDEFEDALGADKVSSSIIPLLLGYRHNFSGFYAEPQIGYGIYGAKVEIQGSKASDSEGAFTWAVGFGFAKNGFDAGVRYQSGSKDGSSTSLVGIHVGYNFSLGGGTASK